MEAKCLLSDKVTMMTQIQIRVIVERGVYRFRPTPRIAVVLCKGGPKAGSLWLGGCFRDPGFFSLAFPPPLTRGFCLAAARASDITSGFQPARQSRERRTRPAPLRLHLKCCVSHSISTCIPIGQGERRALSLTLSERPYV